MTINFCFFSELMLYDYPVSQWVRTMRMVEQLKEVPSN